MQENSTTSEIKETRKFQQNKRAVIPIDLNWRRKYYRKVYIKRAIAFVLDCFSTGILSFIPALILFPEINDETLMTGAFIQPFFFIVLSAMMESSKWQATFGKRIMRIQITDENGNPISFFRSLWRNFLKVVIGYSYILFFPLLIIQIYRFTKTKRLFHDELSDTIIGERFGR